MQGLLSRTTGSKFKVDTTTGHIDMIYTHRQMYMNIFTTHRPFELVQDFFHAKKKRFQRPFRRPRTANGDVEMD